MDYKLDLLEQGCRDFGIELTQQQKEQFVRYYEILVEWNQVMNLTAITEFEEVLVKHFVDSLAVSGVMDVDKVDRVIDIGTGAGFPGIPLKIVYPHLEITLLDSLKKRIGFLNEIVDNLGLKKVETIHGRAEEYAKQKEYRETYDLCVSRAVANLSTLSEYCLPYVKVQGHFVPYKSGKIEEELNDSEKALKILGGRLENVHKFQLGDTEMGRSLVIIKKEKSTPKKYPRKAGMPSKEPLK
ncbi:MAG: 16S rRNA (guanine(527)-N(7))-methyltransferase RsmG [Eubacteriales bacterium]|nr:16S rRNA (guanine(527)-N(7))-methyltransferase RsmG [Eubacteriales bacterium]